MKNSLVLLIITLISTPLFAQRYVHLTEQHPYIGHYILHKIIVENNYDEIEEKIKDDTLYVYDKDDYNVGKVKEIILKTINVGGTKNGIHTLIEADIHIELRPGYENTDRNELHFRGK